MCCVCGCLCMLCIYLLFWMKSYSIVSEPWQTDSISCYSHLHCKETTLKSHKRRLLLPSMLYAKWNAVLDPVKHFTCKSCVFTCTLANWLSIYHLNIIHTNGITRGFGSGLYNLHTTYHLFKVMKREISEVFISTLTPIAWGMTAVVFDLCMWPVINSQV